MILSDSQLAIVNSDSPMIVVVAGAGSGKSTTLCQRILRLKRDGQDLSRVVAISFTTNAAANLQEKLGDGNKVGVSSTIHSFVLMLLRRHGRLVGFPDPPHITVVDSETADQLLVDMIVDEGITSVPKEMIEAEIKKGNQKSTPMMNRTQLAGVAYHRKLVLSNAVTFDTILIHGLRLVPMLTNGLPYDHIMVDEVQDCAPIDHAIFNAMTIPNKFWVGDFSQSIYAFRGADVKLFIELCRRPGVTLFKMEENRRSDILICKNADALIKFDPCPITKVNRPISTEPGNFTVHDCKDVAEELAHIAQLAMIDPDHTAVLVRTNALVKFYIEALEARGVPVVRRRRLPWPADWRKTTMLLAVAANPYNDNLLMTYLRMSLPKREVELIEIKAAEMFVPVVVASGFTFPKENELKNWMAARVSQESVLMLSRIVSKIDGHPSPAAILDALEEIEDELTETSNGSGVTVCTIHKSKGKEWPTVILPAWENGHLPDNAGSDESRRVAFVAITRAEHNCHITWSESRLNPFKHQMEDREPSDFLDEMGVDDPLNFQEQVENQPDEDDL